MKAPSFIIGVSVIFWGWQTGLLIPAVIMALVLEGSRFVAWRWDFSTADFNRISDLCTIIFLGMLVYALASKSSNPAILRLLQWVPMSLFPLMASLAYSTREDIDVSALFLVMRRRGSKGQRQKSITMNPSYPYFALCILSASAANMRTIWFYLGLLLLSAWALLSIRPKRYSVIIWASLLLLAGSAGYIGHVRLHRLQAIVEDKTIEWFNRFLQKEPDAYRSSTAIGEIGTLKSSDRILFRVKVDSQHPSAILLREATYNVYRPPCWFARQSTFTRLQQAGDEFSWELQTSRGAMLHGKQGNGIRSISSLSVSCYLSGNKGILKLPMGSFRIDQLPVFTVKQNQYGTVQVEHGPGLITYRVHYARNASIDSPPTEADLIVPPAEQEVIQETIEELGLHPGSPREIIAAIASHFRKNFSYSLTSGKKSKRTTSLGDFLLRTHSGHCEYFSTATVLLLRRLGIPARYATGYSVHEFSDLEEAFVVRQRHAHAWTLVYRDGYWHDFDTTPAAWIDLEAKAARKWGGLADLWSWCVYTLSKWRWSESKGNAARYISWLLIPLVIFLAWRVYRKKGPGRVEVHEEDSKAAVRSGADSEFYLIEEKLKELGFVRHPWETLSGLIARIDEERPPLIPVETLQSLLKLHYRYRFDPNGISPADRSALRSKVQSWLQGQGRD